MIKASKKKTRFLLTRVATGGAAVGMFGSLWAGVALTAPAPAWQSQEATDQVAMDQVIEQDGWRWDPQAQEWVLIPTVDENGQPTAAATDGANPAATAEAVLAAKPQAPPALVKNNVPAITGGAGSSGGAAGTASSPSAPPTSASQPKSAPSAAPTNPAAAPAAPSAQPSGSAPAGAPYVPPAQGPGVAAPAAPAAPKPAAPAPTNPPAAPAAPAAPPTSAPAAPPPPAPSAPPPAPTQAVPTAPPAPKPTVAPAPTKVTKGS